MSASQRHFDKIHAIGAAEFATHVATLREGSTPEFWAVRWKRPTSSIFWIDFLSWNGALFVRGDLGEAVYEWNKKALAFDFLVGCSFGYFMEKCMASPDGRRPTHWEKDVALEWIMAQRKDVKEQYKDYGRSKAEYTAALEFLRDLQAVAFNQQEWTHFIHEHSDELHDIFPDAHESGIWDAGAVPSTWSIYHWQGMRLALRSLQGSTPW